ncbi:proline-rich proteoglycan 2-like [Dunckerocampus dactyliophorus]|uniref:proline-rich proteoglycan 2-like n=1 Tax=Dunckerocampus dactyliophorus TaxID=161453 RepID=UPI002405A977|nr:proline-rich proteoglycan 2-like [Dunckerocampus dactyliophorus]
MGTTAIPTFDFVFTCRPLQEVYYKVSPAPHSQAEPPPPESHQSHGGGQDQDRPSKTSKGLQRGNPDQKQGAGRPEGSQPLRPAREHTPDRHRGPHTSRHRDAPATGKEFSHGREHQPPTPPTIPRERSPPRANPCPDPLHRTASPGDEGGGMTSEPR